MKFRRVHDAVVARQTSRVLPQPSMFPRVTPKGSHVGAHALSQNALSQNAVSQNTVRQKTLCVEPRRWGSRFSTCAASWDSSVWLTNRPRCSEAIASRLDTPHRRG